MQKDIIKNALINAIATTLYVVVVALSMTYAENLGDIETPLLPVFMLLLFVFSAALVGTLIFGRPILWYLDGRKKDAVVLLAYTLWILFVFIIITLLKIILLT